MGNQFIRKKWWFLLVVAVAAAFLLEIIQIATEPVPFTPVATEEVKSQAITIYPDRVSQIDGLEEKKDGLQIASDGARLVLRTSECGNISQVYFFLNHPIENRAQVRVYYPDAAGSISEIYSAVFTLPEGADFWSCEILEGEYEFLTIELSGSEIPLASISVGTVPADRIETRQGLHLPRILIVVMLLFAVLMWITWTDGWRRFRKTIQNGIRGIRGCGRKSILYALAFPAAIGIAILLFRLFCGRSLTPPQTVFAGFVGLFAVCLFVFGKTLKTQPEYLFLALVLCAGFLYCWYIPHSGLNGWDENAHYEWALKTSYVDYAITTQQDELTIERSFMPACFDLNGEIQKLHTQMDLNNRIYDGQSNKIIPPVGIQEIFNGIGLFVGRALGLRYYMIHFLGRFFGLITYAFLGFFAIRKLKSGKMIAAVSLLIPTEVFIASTYNYDIYLTGFTAVGICHFIALWQNRATKITAKDLLIMVGTITFGCIAKAVYVPLLWMLILMPRAWFPSRKSHIWFIISLVIITGLLGCGHMLSTYMNSGYLNPSDYRGGPDVNAFAQAKYILAHPFEYVAMIWRYLTEVYFNLDRVNEVLTNMAYHGLQPHSYLYLMLMVAVAFTDKNEYDKVFFRHLWTRICVILFSLAAIVFVITAMYMAFTPVGAERAAGAQSRYLIPIVLPVLMFIGSSKIENKMNRRWYNGLIFGMAAFVEFACVYNAIIVKYV